MAKLRHPLETKEIGLKRLKDSYEKNTGSVISTDKMRELETQYEREILPRVYQDGKGNHKEHE